MDKDQINWIASRFEQTGDMVMAINAAAFEYAMPTTKQQIAYGYQKSTGANIMGNRHFWPKYSEQEGEKGYSDINIVDDSLIGKLAQSMSEAIQFPVNTAYLHGLGVIASACTWQFKMEEYGRPKPVNLYVVTAQPPSSGKSAVNEYFSMPIHQYGEEINKSRELKRIELELELGELSGQLKGAEKANNGSRAENLRQSIAEVQQAMKELSAVKWLLTDGTAEALEQVAFSQGGMVNLVSDESDAINVILGTVYASDSGGKSNHGLMLKMWDGGYHSSTRITREGGAGYVRGSIAVIAQDDGIDSVIRAGASGRGISERILLLRERTLLGTRKHVGKRKRVDRALLDQYDSLIRNIMHEQDVVLSFSDDADQIIDEYRDRHESELCDMGRFGATSLRGAFGKCDKQIRKLAAVMHIAEHWQDGGSRQREISVEMIGKAIHVYSQLFEAYIGAMESQGAAGDEALIDATKEKLRQMVEKKKRYEFTLKEFRDSYSKVQPFKQHAALTSVLRERVLPALVDQGAIATHEDEIFVSPYLVR